MSDKSRRTVTFVRTRTIVVTELHEAVVDGDEPPHTWPTPDFAATPTAVLPVSNTTVGGQIFPGTAAQYLRAQGVPRPSLPPGSTSEQWREATQKWLESLP